MAYKFDPDNPMFRALTDEEESEFIEYARTNEPHFGSYEAYHPVCRAEWARLGKQPKKEVK